MAEPTQGSSVFISYSRKDKAFVRKLNDSLDSNGVNAWVDWEGIPLSSDWMDEITRAIEGADTFIFVISPDSLSSEVCADELELGLKYNKKLVPILYREPEKGNTMHEKIAATNWVYMREQDDYEGTIPGLIEAINTDLDWVRQHTRLLQRAKEWESKNRNSSFLLRGSDLADAEHWMSAAAAQSGRQVVQLQADYIEESRKGAMQRQRIIMGGVLTALVVSIGLTIWALQASAEATQNYNIAATAQVDAEENAKRAQDNYQQAEENRKIAEQNAEIAKANEIEAKAQQKAAEAQLFQSRAGELETSTLLAIDSWSKAPSFQAEEIIRQNLSILPQPVAATHQDGHIWNITLSPDNSQFATASDDGTACVWQFADIADFFCVDHEDIVYDALFTSDGTQLITGSKDGFVKFWDASNGSPGASFEYGSRIWDLDISPDGRWLAIGREDGFVTVLDLEDITEEPVTIEEPGSVLVVKFSPDSKWLAAGTTTGPVRLWEVDTVTSVVGPEHTADVFAVAFSADSKYIASASADSTARLGNVGQGLERLTLRHGDWVEDVDFSPDGTWFVTASDDNRVWVWDTETGEERLRMRHANFVQKVKVSPDGQWIASTGYDLTLRIWDAASGSQAMQASLNGIGSAIRFTPDGSYVLVGDQKGNTTIWDISSLAARVSYIEFPEYLHEVELSPNGDWYVINADDKLVWQFGANDLRNARYATDGKAILEASSLTYSVDISSDAKWMVVAEEIDTNQAILYNFETGNAEILEHGDSVLGVAFNPDNSLAATAGKDGYVLIWDVATAEFLYALEHDSQARSIDFSPDGTQLAVGTENETVIWDVAEREQLYVLPQAGTIRTLQYSNDGHWLVTSSLKGTTYVWNAQDSAFNVPVFTLRHNGGILHFAFSPNFRYLVGGGTDNFAHVWDLSLGQEVTRIPHVERVTGVTFSQDGTLLITASRKVVQVWDVNAFEFVPTDNLISTACARLTANLSEAEWETLFPDETYRPTCPDLPVGQN